MLNAAEIGRVFLWFVTIKTNCDVNWDENKLRSVDAVEYKNAVVERKHGEMGENPENTGVLPTEPVDNSVDNVE